jgi:hypothetical protein
MRLEDTEADGRVMLNLSSVGLEGVEWTDLARMATSDGPS